MAVKKDKTRVLLFILLAVVLGVSAMLGTWYVNWWGMVLPWQVLSISIGILSLACLISYLAYLLFRLLSPAKLDTQQQTQLEREKWVKRELLETFQRANRGINAKKGSYATPWYLLLSQSTNNNEQLLQEMGFEPLAHSDSTQVPSVVRFWASEFAIIAAIDQFDSHYFDLSVDVLLDCFNKHRPRQGANGVLISVSVSWLLEQQQGLIAQQAKHFSTLIARCNKSMRLNLPIYNVMTDLSAVSDLQKLFSCFDDQRLEEPLGALMEATTQGYDEAWFTESFNDIQSQLFVQTTYGLKAQLNSQYRESIVVGPYQFALLKVELQEYFKLLYLDNNFQESGLNFRGYFFTNHEKDQTSVDKLSLLLASELGYDQYSKTPSEPGKSLFNKQLFKSQIIAEAGLVGVNNRRENSYRIIGFIFSSSLVLSLIMSGGLIKYNYDFYQALDARALLQLEKYQDDLKRSDENIDDLTVPIHRLSELSDIKNIYTEPKPWFVVDWLPSASIQPAVDKSFQLGLQQILLPALRDYLLKDMFVYNKLEDQLKSIELYNLYKRLYNPLRTDISVLESYYINSLKEEGEGDPVTLDKFRVLLAQGLQPGMVPPKDRQPLIGIVKASLSKGDVSEILYQHMLQRPGFSRRVDLRERLGHEATFSFNYPQGYSGYLIPFIFTRDGFSQLMLGSDFQLSIDEIKSFEEVVGEITSQSQLSRINQEVKRLYVDDYINAWQDFYENVNLSSLDDPAKLRNTLTLMGDASRSPLIKLQDLLSNNTNLLDLIEASKLPPPGDKDSAVTDLALQQSLLEKQASALQMAKTIARPFAAQHQLMKADDNGLRPIDVALAQIREGLEWVDTAIEKAPRGSSLLMQLGDGTGVNPLARMQDLAASFSDKLLSQYIADSAYQLNSIAMAEVRAFINQQWRDNVLSFYQAKLANRYPFATNAEQDASREDFEAFFRVGGIVDKFNSEFLAGLPQSNQGQRNLTSFINTSPTALNNELDRFLAKVKDIQKRMYSAGELKVNFTLRTQEMSSGLLEISLHGERKIYSYRNGPKMWSSMSWPSTTASSQDIELQIKTLNNHFLRVSFVGFWSWFKLADRLHAVPVKQHSTSLLDLENKGEIVKLLLRVKGAKTPFLKHYFSSLRVPSEL